MSESKALDDVIAERARQQYEEGWDSAHDDTHTSNELAAAAACYLNPMYLKTTDNEDPLPLGWPGTWAAKWWKPREYRQNLVRAAALAIAEIERHDRQNGLTDSYHHVALSDSIMLNWLEHAAQNPGGILLHAELANTGRLGLGLNLAGRWRSLRDAIKAATP